PRQKRPERHNTYTTALALFALLEARRADVPWEGSKEKRDELIGTTARWLVSKYSTTADQPGWTFGDESPDTITEGLTLQIYGLLIRANLEAGVSLPETKQKPVVQFLRHFADRTIGDHDQETGEATYIFTSHRGEELIARHLVRFEWYPWVV